MSKKEALKNVWDRMNNGFREVQQAYYTEGALAATGKIERLPEIEKALIAARDALGALEREMRIKQAEGKDG